MDTGASCNVISANSLQKTNFDFKKLHKSKNILKTYDGTRIDVLGTALLTCEHRNDKKVKILFYVVAGDFTTLLSAKTCLQMGFIKNLVNQDVKSIAK